MQWEVACGAVEEDEFLVDWKASVRANARARARRRRQLRVRGWPADVRAAAAAAREHGAVQQLGAGAPLYSAGTPRACIQPFALALALTRFTSTPNSPAQHVSTHPAPAMPNLFLLPLTPCSSRLQAVSDIADLVSARSRAALSVPAQRPAPSSRRTPPLPCRLQTLQPRSPQYARAASAADARASSAQQHLPAGEREAILSKI